MQTSTCTANTFQPCLDMGDSSFLDVMFDMLAKHVPRQVATTCNNGKKMMQGVKSTPPSSPTTRNGDNTPWAPKKKKREVQRPDNGTVLFPDESMN